jgi:hypothetical protein
VPGETSDTVQTGEHARFRIGLRQRGSTRRETRPISDDTGSAVVDVLTLQRSSVPGNERETSPQRGLSTLPTKWSPDAETRPLMGIMT